MKYEKIITAKFLERPNRFIAKVEITDSNQRVVTCHVKNTGRCKEILVPGAKVYLEDFRHRMGNRKLEFSLVGVEKETEQGPLMINMDSQAPNRVVAEALKCGKIQPLGLTLPLQTVEPEKTFGNSRFDFYIEDVQGEKGYIEVKGVTLEQDGIVSFPDAPTKRGVKHVRELIEVKRLGYYAEILFVVQMEGMKEFRPNVMTHPEFGEVLSEAQAEGVVIRAWECKVGADSLEVTKEIPVRLF